MFGPVFLSDMSMLAPQLDEFPEGCAVHREAATADDPLIGVDDDGQPA